MSVPLFFYASVEPWQHYRFRSKTGKRAALLKHVSLFDSSASEVTVSGGRLFTRYIAYKYYGDGDDNMGASSLQWIDDHHLVIRYQFDPTGEQRCYSRVGDVQVACQSLPDPFADGRNSVTPLN
jgi:hypothetical protein